VQKVTLLACVLLVSCQPKQVADAETAVKEKLSDPDSAKFRNVSIDANGLAVCGEVMSRNFMGGYTGYHTFYYDTFTHEVGMPDFWEAGSQAATYEAAAYKLSCQDAVKRAQRSGI
jgi:hypothetical protein